MWQEVRKLINFHYGKCSFPIFGCWRRAFQFDLRKIFCCTLATGLTSARGMGFLSFWTSTHYLPLAHSKFNRWTPICIFLSHPRCPYNIRVCHHQTEYYLHRSMSYKQTDKMNLFVFKTRHHHEHDPQSVWNGMHWSNKVVLKGGRWCKSRGDFTE